MSQEKKELNTSDIAGGMVFVGALLIGVGLGLTVYNMATSVMVGLGVGFILFGFVKVLYRR